MAKLASIANGSFTASTTWGVIEETSFRASTQNFGWGPFGGLISTGNFTPTATTTVTHAGFRLVGTGPDGVIECDIINVTANTTVAGSFFSMNKTAFRFNSGSSSQSWFMLKFPSPVTLTSGISYAIRLNATIATITLATTNGAATPTLTMRFLVTNVNQAPVAGDDLFINAEYTTGSTVSGFTVTMDNTTSATTFGSNGTGFGGVNISQDTSLNYGTSANTNYYLRLNGNLWLNAGATFNMGTTANTIPSTSTAVLEFSGATQGIRANGNTGPTGFTAPFVFNVAGVNPTYPYALLAADVSAGATTFTTNVPTGWKNGDQVVLAGTNAVATGQDLRTMSGDASGTTVRVTATLTNAHGGSGDIVGEVINLTRNAKIRNSNASQGTLSLENTLMNIQGCEIRNMGVFSVTGAASKIFQYSSFYNSTRMQPLVTGPFNFDYNCFYNCPYFFAVDTATPAGSTGSASTINFNYFILATSSSSGYLTSVSLNPQFTDFIGNRLSGLNGNVSTFYGAVTFAYPSTSTSYTSRLSNGIVSANTVHSSVGGFGAYLTSSLNIYDCNVWRIAATNPGIGLFTTDGVKLYRCNFFGNAATSGQLFAQNTYNNEVINCNFRGGTTVVATRGAVINAQSQVTFRNCTFGTGQTHSVGDVIIAVTQRDIRLTFENSLLNSTTKFSSLVNLWGGSFVKLQRYQQTANNHYIYTAVGNAAQYDGVIFRTGVASTRLIPLTTTFKHQSPIKIIPVTSGTSPTVSVWVRKSTVSDASGANYNGAQPRLMLAYSPSVFNYTGQTDQVLATASAALGTWEQLTATIPYTAYNNGGFEVYVDCDGTAGWINVDDWSVT